MKLSTIFSRSACTLVLTFGLNSTAGAQTNTNDIIVGMTLPLSGFNAAAGQEGLAVTKAAFDSVNATGGIQGRKIKLVALDDGFVANKAADNANILESQGAIAIFNCWGTGACSAILPIIKDKKIPLVAGIAGGGPMRSDPGRYAFNIRPTTVDEVARMVKQMLTVGQTRIAVLYQDDPFGKSGQTAAQSVLKNNNIKPVVEIAVAADGSNADKVADQLRDLSANAAIIVGSPRATVALIKQARKSGSAIQFYNLAAQANQKVIADLGESTQGAIFTTLVPSPWKTSLVVVKDYQNAIKTNDSKIDASYTGLEVYINAQILIEGLKRAGSKVNRENLVFALENMGEKRFSDLFSVKFGPNDRTGSGYVGLAIIGSNKRFVE